MEMVLVLIVLIALAWYLGLFDMFERSVGMGTREVKVLEAKHKVKVAKDLAALEINEENMEEAKKKLALLDTLEF